MLRNYKYKKQALLSVLLVLISGLFVACSTSSAATETEPVNTAQVDYAGKKIVWVDSYHDGYEWADGIGFGIKDALEDTGVELKVIHMDTKRNPDEAFAKEAAVKAKAEIESYKPDVVIASDDNAQKYLVVPYLKDTDMSVIFAGVNWDASGYGFPSKNVTGIVEVELPAQLVEHLKQFSQGDKVTYLTADSETERTVAQIYNDKFFNGQMNVIWVDSIDSFKDGFLQAQEEADIVFLGNNAGPELEQWDEAEMAKFFEENATVPTGSINPWMAPYSLIVLGKVPEEHGEWAVEAALDIMEGTPVSDIAVAENKKGNLILNLDLAEKLDIVFPPSLLKNAEMYSRSEN